MKLPLEALEDFRAHWQAQFGEQLTLDQTRTEAERVLRTFGILHAQLLAVDDATYRRVTGLDESDTLIDQ
jgi:hypothetical protein